MEINARILSALAKHIAADKDSRYYLNGVLVEVSAKDVRYVATDGHKLAIARSTHSQPYTGQCYNVIIPVETCLKVKPKAKAVIESAELTSGDKFGTLTYLGDQFIFEPIDAVFPDYRAIIPAKIVTDGKAAGFNPTLLRAFQLLAKDLGMDACPEFYADGNSPACVTFTDPWLFGIVMPLRLSNAVYPDWLKPADTIALAA